MEALADEYRSRGFQFVFVYVREPHPGEHYPHHTSMAQKLAHARAFRDQFGIRRDILVDDLAGTGHRAFGCLPNMTWILTTAHRVFFKADWTDPPTIRLAMEYLLGVQELRRRGGRVAPFYVELQGYRWNDPAAFDEGLRRAGPKAYAEFQEALKLWERDPSKSPRRQGA